jgi:hypothetical protein
MASEFVSIGQNIVEAINNFRVKLETFITNTNASIAALSSSVITTGSYTPIISATSSAPVVTYTTQTGRYTKQGTLVSFDLHILVNTLSGGSSSATVTLPFNVANYTPVFASYTGNVDFGGGNHLPIPVGVANSSYMVLYATQSKTAATIFSIGALSSGSEIGITGVYETV